ncbi:MAG: flavodoxin family protein [Firmicutes bacterium]|nr:flavodoxin family protein [Bacillota bacterium]
MKVKILGISGSPRKGNTEMMVVESLKAAAEIPDVETDLVDLRGKLSPCIDCDRCPVDPPSQYCAIRDKMDTIYPKLIEADGIILGAPVYFGSVNAQVKAMMDRCRPLGRCGHLLKYKVGGAITVGACRNGGQEKALGTIVDYYILTGILPVGLLRVLQVGAMGLGWRAGMIKDDEWKAEFLPEGKVTWVDQCREIGRTVAVMSRVVKEGMRIVDPNRFITGWKLEREKLGGSEGH